MSKDAAFQVGVKALILNNKHQVLLLRAGPAERKHYDTDFWDLPGGRIKEGDTIEETLRREIEEELGADGNALRINNLFEATIANFKADAKKNLQLLLLIYHCHLQDTPIFTLSDEHSEWKWTPISAAKKLLSVKFDNQFLTKLDKLAN